MSRGKALTVLLSILTLSVSLELMAQRPTVGPHLAGPFEDQQTREQVVQCSLGEQLAQLELNHLFSTKLPTMLDLTDPEKLSRFAEGKRTPTAFCYELGRISDQLLGVSDRALGAVQNSIRTPNAHWERGLGMLVKISNLVRGADDVCNSTDTVDTEGRAKIRATMLSVIRLLMAFQSEHLGRRRQMNNSLTSLQKQNISVEEGAYLRTYVGNQELEGGNLLTP